MVAKLDSLVSDECVRTKMLKDISPSVLLDVIREHLQGHTASDSVYLLLTSLCDGKSAAISTGMNSCDHIADDHRC